MSHKLAPIAPLSATNHNEAPKPLVGADATKRATIGLDMLTYEQLEEFGDELDGVRQRVLDDLGQADANYIRRVIRVQQSAEILGRITIFAGVFNLWAILAGVLLLGLSKILDNMEIGHNVMHGQYDWMNDPVVDAKNYEWDNAANAQDWKRGHNYLHHTYTNIHGLDRDIGYGLLRIDDDQPWYPNHRFNLPLAFTLMLFFEWGVAYHGIELDDYLGGKMTKKEFADRKSRAAHKARGQLTKDFIAYPALALVLIPFVGWWAPLAVMGANFVANLIRNIWTFLIIFCGHFPAEVATFAEEDAQNESRGQWYLRQLLGSANISGSLPFHILAGNLSHQIEHHLFPDIPARRYPAVAREVRPLVEKYGLQYNSGRLSRQLWSVARQLGVYGAKPADPYKQGKSPESKALRKAKREAEAAKSDETSGTPHLTA